MAKLRFTPFTGCLLFCDRFMGAGPSEKFFEVTGPKRMYGWSKWLVY